MSTTLDEPVAVELVEGQPALFWWKRFPYVIEGQSMLFYRRRRTPWWTGEGDTQRIDDEFWRVSAARDGSQDSPELYDLRNDGRSWTLVLAW